MSKKRVYELAKDVNVPNKELIKMMGKMGIDVKNHMSSVEDEDVVKVQDFFSRDKGNETAREKAKAKMAMTKPKVEHKPVHKEEPAVTKVSEPQVEKSEGMKVSQEKARPQNTVKHASKTTKTGHDVGQKKPTNRRDNEGAKSHQPSSSNHKKGADQRSNQGKPQSNDSSRPRTQGGQQGDQRNKSQSQSSQQSAHRSKSQSQGSQQTDNRNKGQNQGGQQSDSRNRGQGQGNQQQSRPGQTKNNQQQNKPSTNKNNQQQSKPGNNKGNNKNKSSYNNQNDKPKKSRASYRKEKRDAVAAASEAAERERETQGIMEEDGVRIIQVADAITVKDLSLRIGIQTSDIVKHLFKQGQMVTANQEVDFDTAVEIADAFDVLVEKEEVLDILETFFETEPDSEDDLKVRPPVVVVMGHVDHGKTSLLDAIRDSSVTATEHGGITQHIGASVVKLEDGQEITFLDTPGHEAFTAMRLRGALATDIAILVVAADDGVMPQTVEAINHAKAAGVEIIIAINKIDKPGANPDRVKQELIEHGLTTEDWGGDTIAVQVSALQKTNLDQLMEMIILTAEMAELKANPNKKAKGIVIESLLDKGRGPVATVLVQEGTLTVGDSIVAGTSYGRVRAMFNDLGERVKTAGPSKPVEVLGLSEVPLAGETFYTAKNEREARHVAEKVQVSEREKMIQHTPHRVTLDDLFTQIQAGEMKELKLIVKADVQGSVEAVRSSLLKLSNEEVMINVIHGGVGAVNESDVMLASASNAIIIGFNVRPENTAKSTAEREEIDIRLYRVIYNAIEDIEAAMKGMLDPIFAEKVTGFAEVRQTFTVSGVGTIAGSYMKEGKIARNSKVRVVRDGIVVCEGDLASLKRFKDDVKEVAAGYECGIMVEKFNDIKEGDIIEAFVMEEIPR